jgi:signal transduction histidine kinase
MNRSSAAATPVRSAGRSGERQTQRQARWHIPRRVVWVVAALLVLVIFLGSLPDYLRQLQTTCTGSRCTAGQLSPDSAQALQAHGLSLGDYALATLVLTLFLALVCFALGSVVCWRRSQDGMALLVALLVVLLSTTGVTNAVGPTHSGWRWPALLLDIVSIGVFFLVFALFPTGRFVPRWARWIPLGYGLLSLPRFLFPDSLSPTLLPWPPLLVGLWLLLAFGLLPGSLVVAQSYRYWRVSSRLERQQTKWVLFGGLAAAGEISGLFLLAVLFPALNQPGSLYQVVGSWVTTGAQLLVPLCLAVAILRYRLWEIDIIINRTLVYGALTTTVVGLYILVVGYLGTLVRTGGNLLISLVGAGLVAVLFQPWRSWLQRGVNRLMYGQRDEPYAVVARLGRRLEHTLAPEAMLSAIVETVAQALKLPYAAITLKQGEDVETAAAYGSTVEGPLTLPLTYQTEPIGQLVLGPRQRGEAFTPADRRLLEVLARQVGIAAHVVQLTSDLQHSRQRLVTAREEERRRLRRDLHDGLGPTLGGLTLKVGAIRNLLPRDQATADVLLAELSAEIEGAVGDIRRLVYELRPPSLDELGLVGAIQAHAAHYRLPARTDALADRGNGPAGAHQIAVEAPAPLPPLPAAVEVAAYRIVLEALANVARHAQARTCRVCLRVAEMLEVEVSDDGVGLPAERPTGVGLVSMRERAAELGGTCLIESMPAGGVRVLARLPMPKE